jgi:hypothetical protein
MSSAPSRAGCLVLLFGGHASSAQLGEVSSLAALIRYTNTMPFERNAPRAAGATAVPMMLATPAVVMNSRHLADLARDDAFS